MLFKGWPDHGVPGEGRAMDCFEMMMDRFVTWILKSEPHKRAIVHCSAGVGRTGTTIALAHLLINIQS